jgi:hypothetical protein
MNNHRATTQQSWIAWVVTGAAALLGLLAMIIVFQDVAGNQRATNPWITGLNFLTGLGGVAGAFGYALRKRWGIYAFGASVVGHWASHTLLIVSAIMQNRMSVFIIGGLLVIPTVALIVWIAMVRGDNRRNVPEPECQVAPMTPDSCAVGVVIHSRINCEEVNHAHLKR